LVVIYTNLSIKSNRRRREEQRKRVESNMAGRATIPARNSALIAMIADEVNSLPKNSSFYMLMKDLRFH
jgi:hypothetical protein